MIAGVGSRAMVDAVPSGRYAVFARFGSLLLCGCLLGVPVLAQTAALPLASCSQPVAAKSDADTLVDQLVENAAVLHATLPSITAHERVETHASKGILWQNSTGEGIVRVLRAASGGLKETHEMASYNGKPATPGQQKGVSQLVDGFIAVEDMFFSRRYRPCYTFTLASQPAKDGLLELRIALNSAYASMPKCNPGFEGLTGVARIDPATRQLTHLEFNIPNPIGHQVPFASEDYAPSKIGEKTFWLPTENDTLAIINKAKVRTAVYYSDYHLFAASVTILPAGSEPETPPASPQ
jgi:hypothetical protein